MIRTIAVAVVAIWAYGSVRLAAEMGDLERRRLLAHMEMTAGWLSDEISNLTAAQFHFRPAPGQWSVAEVLEHLVVVAPIYREDLQAALRQKARNRSAMTDADVLWYGIDRTRKEQAIPTERPPGRLRDLRAALAAYREHHDRLFDYIKTTRDDLRGHIVERQGCDAYQWALLISTHEQRHILQIREIKAHLQFPKNGKAQRDRQRDVIRLAARFVPDGIVPAVARSRARRTRRGRVKLEEVAQRARRLSKPYRVTNGRRFSLKDFNPSDTGPFDREDRPRAEEALRAGIEALCDLQERLYAQDPGEDPHRHHHQSHDAGDAFNRARPRGVKRPRPLKASAPSTQIPMSERSEPRSGTPGTR